MYLQLIGRKFSPKDYWWWDTEFDQGLFDIFMQSRLIQTPGRLFVGRGPCCWVCEIQNSKMQSQTKNASHMLLESFLPISFEYQTLDTILLACSHKVYFSILMVLVMRSTVLQKHLVFYLHKQIFVYQHDLIS